MSANLAEPLGFADLLNTSKNIRKFKKKIPPVEAITTIAESGKASLSSLPSERVEFTIIYDEKMKNRMAQASETMFKTLCDKAQNDIDIAKLNAYSHYAMFFIKAPVVIAVVSLTRNAPDLTRMTHQMRQSANTLGLELYDLCPQLCSNKEFSQILGLESPAHVVTLLGAGYCEEKVY